MAAQQLKLTTGNGKGRRPPPKAKDDLQTRWLHSQSTGQLLILLTDVSSVLARRNLHLNFRVIPPSKEA